MSELKELVNKSGLVKPLAEYDERLHPLIDELCRGPQWFVSLHKLVSGQTFSFPPSTLPTRCRIYHHFNSEHQFLVILPNQSDGVDVNAFIIVDNGVVPTDRIVSSTDSLINIIFRRNVIDSEEVSMLVEAIGKAICYYIWQTVVTSSASLSSSS